MKAIGIIPARYKSSRFPGKPLADLLGKPMIIWVCELTEQALGKANTYVATDDKRIAQVVEEYGYAAIMTSEDNLTGTDRLAEVSREIEADIYINIQGDEPMIDPSDIINVMKVKQENPGTIINAMTIITADEDASSVNLPKVITALNNDLIYMSRLPIPGNKSGNQHGVYYKQVCIYAFTKEELALFASRNEKTPLENHEDIEILRFLEMGKKIKMVEVSKSSLAVDIPSDLIKVTDALRNR
jgi:3-deoxy-manno-octulosonate cytidylyltransferase (CMP-KDO synthetase)